MPLHYAQAVEALMQGERIMQTNPDAERPDQTVRYGRVSNGKTVTATAFRKLAEEGKIRAARDGLFPEDSQTFEWAQ